MRLLPAAVLLLAGCAGGQRAATPEEARPTIVSLNPCTDAILAEVTAPGQLLAISHYSKDPNASSMDPADAARFAATGGTVEEVLALDPDIVVASSFLAPATRSAFTDLGVRVETFGGTTSVEQSLDQVRALADMAGHPEAGQALVRRIGDALRRATGQGAGTVEAAVWQPGGIVPGEAALVSDLLRRTGFAGYGARRGLAQADYLALEQVLADPPDVLLVAGSDVGQRHPALENLPAMRRERFDTRLIYCGGPTIARAAERLAAIRGAMP